MQRSLVARLCCAVMAFAVSGVMVVAGAAPASAVGPVEILTGLKSAYDAYEKYFGGQLTLAQAVTQIEDAIGQAKTEILTEIDLMAASQAQACSRTAVLDLQNLNRKTLDQQQAYATSTLACVELAKVDINNLATPVGVDLVAFAMNAVGPIALIVNASVGFNTTDLTAELRAANQQSISRLAPSCTATPLTGDSEPGGQLEYQLICRAFNGNVGYDSVFVWPRRGRPLHPFDFTVAIDAAMAGTSYPVSVAAIADLSA